MVLSIFILQQQTGLDVFPQRADWEKSHEKKPNNFESKLLEKQINLFYAPFFFSPFFSSRQIQQQNHLERENQQ